MINKCMARVSGILIERWSNLWLRTENDDVLDIDLNWQLDIQNLFISCIF